MNIGPFAPVSTRQEMEIAYPLAATWLTLVKGFPFSNFDKSMPSMQTSKPEMETFLGATLFLKLRRRRLSISLF
jgi:hypothetical protein